MSTKVPVEKTEKIKSFLCFQVSSSIVTDNIPNQTRRRRRCRSWNANPTIPVEADDINGQNVENSVFGESVICLSRDGFQLIVSFDLRKKTDR